jgi:subtilisin
VDFTGGGPPGTVRIKGGSCSDGNGHGTHVAGTILADGGSDGLGVYGLAPEARLLAYKVCGNSGCWGDDIAAAIDYAGDAARGDADIVSMSLSGNGESSLIRDAIARNAHLLIVAAAGNDGPAENSIDYPAANVAVGAIDATFAVASFCSRGIDDGNATIGAREVELGAPGVAVESTWNDRGYRYLSGTSMATPHVSGLAAKLWQGDAVATRALLRSLAEDIWDIGYDTATGFGLPRLPALTQ